MNLHAKKAEILIKKLFIVPIKILRHTIQITNDRPIQRLNYQWQANI